MAEARRHSRSGGLPDAQLRDRGGEAVALVAARRDDAHCVGIDTMGRAQHPDTDTVALKLAAISVDRGLNAYWKWTFLFRCGSRPGIVDRTSPSQALSRCIACGCR